jgi:hypothetical protein
MPQAPDLAWPIQGEYGRDAEGRRPSPELGKGLRSVRRDAQLTPLIETKPISGLAALPGAMSGPTEP